MIERCTKPTSPLADAASLAREFADDLCKMHANREKSAWSRSKYGRTAERNLQRKPSISSHEWLEKEKKNQTAILQTADRLAMKLFQLTLA